MIYSYKDYSNVVEDKKVSYFICSSSFEARCLVIPDIISQSKLKKSFVFFNDNEVNDIIQNAEILSKKLPESELINLNSDEPIYNYKKIMNVINSIANSSLANKNILIDSTTFTHESLLILLRLLETYKEQLGEIFISYVGAEEYSTNETEDEEKWLSKGVDEIRTIIGYPGFTDPTKRNHLIILFGFELDRTKKIIDEYEFDIISLGFGDLPIQNNHMKINCERHKRLLSVYPEAREFKFSLIDPNQAKDQLIEYIEKNTLSSYNTVIAPLNNKVSTIGAGLAAISNENIQLAYAKASMYNIQGYSIPNEDIYLHKLTF
jgi:hypothetical protein